MGLGQASSDQTATGQAALDTLDTLAVGQAAVGHACVVGMGLSGVAAARLLKQLGWTVTLSDRGDSERLRQDQVMLAAEGITVDLGVGFDPDALAAELRQQTTLVVVSPGVPWDLPGLVKARDQGLDMVGEMGLAWRSLPSHPWICITGTNGKTTTTALVAAIFKSAGLIAPACGNIGYAAADVVRQTLAGEPLDWVLAEVSSYQIESGWAMVPRIGVWTTLTPDHLERHKTLETYAGIKAHLLSQSELQILNGDDPFIRECGVKGGVFDRPNVYWTSVSGKAGLVANPDQGIYLEEGWVVAMGERIVEAASLRMAGSHNLQNLLMAVGVARLAGLKAEAIAAAIAQFPGVVHRLEYIRTWRGIDFINDSKATNYDAAEVGLAAVSAPVVLIAGGAAKQGEDGPWLQKIQEKAAAVVLIGEAAGFFGERLQAIGFDRYEDLQTMDRAVVRAAAWAEALGAKVVLLSPACASFDQYRNFELRGDDFRQACLELVESPEVG
jgi:UDP-N-acetylmuramoylalanine--D-glutamate ligase